MNNNSLYSNAQKLKGYHIGIYYIRFVIYGHITVVGFKNVSSLGKTEIELPFFHYSIQEPLVKKKTVRFQGLHNCR